MPPGLAPVTRLTRRSTYLLYFLNFCREYFDSALLPFVTGKLSRFAISRLMDAFSSSTYALSISLTTKRGNDLFFCARHARTSVTAVAAHRLDYLDITYGRYRILLRTTYAVICVREILQRHGAIRESESTDYFLDWGSRYYIRETDINFTYLPFWGYIEFTVHAAVK